MALLIRNDGCRKQTHSIVHAMYANQLGSGTTTCTTHVCITPLLITLHCISKVKGFNHVTTSELCWLKPRGGSNHWCHHSKLQSIVALLAASSLCVCVCVCVSVWRVGISIHFARIGAKKGTATQEGNNGELQ